MMNHSGMGSEWMEESEDQEFLFEADEVVQQDDPIEYRASEAEKLYANLLMVTDFDRSLIEEVLEFEPDEEAQMRIDELRRKRREMEELAQNGRITKTVVL